MITMTNIPHMLTIPELAKEYKGTGVTEYRIRQLALSGDIVCFKAGRKILVNADKFAEYLNSTMIEQPQESYGMQRIAR